MAPRKKKRKNKIKKMQKNHHMGSVRRKRVEERQTERAKQKEFPVALVFSFL
jgi:hypothetical protein